MSRRDFLKNAAAGAAVLAAAPAATAKPATLERDTPAITASPEVEHRPPPATEISW